MMFSATMNHHVHRLGLTFGEGDCFVEIASIDVLACPSASAFEMFHTSTQRHSILTIIICINCLFLTLNKCFSAFKRKLEGI